MRDDRVRLLDMLEAIQRIERHAVKGRLAFAEDELLQSWIVRHLEILGEAVRGLSPQFLAEHPEVAWSDIVGMRNILIHRYFEIDQEAVWAAVERALPPLKAQVEAMLAELPPHPDAGGAP
ncbi:MAG: DUF86 domain-containing protein [Anaerolineales bacterium]|nr:DUF86 domain-containing protein [Anaerolineales bacterium]